MTEAAGTVGTATDLCDLLRRQAARQPEGTACIFLADGDADSEQERLTYGELDAAARRIAAQLRRAAPQGGRALLLYPSGLEYVRAFFGCVYAGMAGVCAYPPPLSGGRRLLPRLRAIVADAQPAVALTNAGMLAHAQTFVRDEGVLAELPWLAPDGGPAAADDDDGGWSPPALAADDLAFLMYTSGSTGTPRGVMVSHGNVLHNLAAFPGFAARPLTASVSWLPLFHDLGLVFGLLHPLYQGAPAILLPPDAFVRRPLRWLSAISRFRASATFGPNFAYDLCARRIAPAERAGLDLSCLNLVLNGSEPVRHETLERFAAAFGSCGFRGAAFYPAFGLSEGTSDVSGNASFAPPLVCTLRGDQLDRHQVVAAAPGEPGARQVVGCGTVLPGQRVAIVDPATLAPCAADQVGEIWLGGPSVAQGYWARPAETAETFGARLAGSGDGPFLRTGDLGFLRGGELFVTGRLKDLVIVHGVNHYPQDIESSVERSHAALRPGCGIAFGCEADGGEGLVVVQEVEAAPAATLDEALGNIRQQLVEEHQVAPWAIVLIAAGTLPKTSSGKLQRRACREAFLAGELAPLAEWRAAPGAMPEGVSEETPDGAAGDPLEAWLAAAVARLAGIAPQAVDRTQPFARYGLTSVAITELVAELEALLGRRLPLTLLFEHPTVASLAGRLRGGLGAAALPEPASSASAANAVGAVGADGAAPGGREPIAIVGMSCRLPGAPDLRAYWELLRDGVDAVGPIPLERWDVDGLYDPNPAAAGKMNTRQGGFLSGLDRFDPLFFSISPAEAAHLDPRQRLVLELAWESLAHAGIPAASLRGSSTGVFIGTMTDDFFHLLLDDPARGDAYSGTGGANSLVANRVSYCLDLRGPSMAVDTACSGSLVAIHLACQSLWSGESSAALAGGVMVNLRPDGFLFFSRAGALAPDGRCKPFDARADGIGRAEGAGMLVLKPLSRARADGDRVLAVIRGSAINQDGMSNGLTAPQPRAQEALLRQACRRAGVAPGDVQYVEAHGTGTPLGDAVEMTALAAALGQGRSAERPLMVGSVKSNFGHAEAAAGVASVIKVVLAMRHRLLPPSLHFQAPSPQLELDRLPVRVQHVLSRWPAEERPLVAGVSAFGIGGANAHVVLGEAPQEAAAASGAAAAPAVRQAGAGGGIAHLLPLSARDARALAQLAGRTGQWLGGAGAAEPLDDLCYTAAVRRDHHPHRWAASGRTHAEMAAALAAFAATAQGGHGGPGGNGGQDGAEPMAAAPVMSRPRLIMVFSGQGSQWVRMGQGLAEREPVFREALARVARLFPARDGRSLLDQLAAGAADSRLDAPEVLQPATFAVQVALFELWRSWGLTPDAVAGHSLGEVAAAYACGALCIEDAARVVEHRSRLMQWAMGPGTTAQVQLPEERAAEVLAGHADVELAGASGPSSFVVSGGTTAVAQLLAELGGRGVRCRVLRVGPIALHSRFMDPLQEPLAAALGSLRPGPARIPFFSAVTGGALAGERLDAGYWVRNLRQPFRFRAAMRAMLEAPEAPEDGGGAPVILLEVSPHPLLAAPMQDNLRQLGRQGLVLSSLRRDEDERGELLAALGRAYAAGRDVAWPRLYPAGRVLDLPGYPWQRERHWYQQRRTASPAGSDGRDAGGVRGAAVAPGPDADQAAALFDVEWVPIAAAPVTTPPAAAAAGHRGAWVLVCGGLSGDALAGALAAAGAAVWRVAAGERYAAPAAGGRQFTIDMAAPADWRRLLADLPAPAGQGAGEGRTRLVLLFGDDIRAAAVGEAGAVGTVGVAGAAGERGPIGAPAAVPETADAGAARAATAALLYAVQAAAQLAAPPQLWVVTRGAQPPGAVAAPDQALLWGLARAFGQQEHPELWGGVVDLDPAAEPGSLDEARRLRGHVLAPGGEDQVSLRQGERYAPRLRRRPAAGTGGGANPPAAGPARPRADATYLVTGGFGALGLRVARWLVARGARRLLLLGRHGLPPRRTWSDVPAADPYRQRIDAVRALESAGASVHLAAADVADAAAVAGLVDTFEREAWPPVRGVVHAAGVVDDRLLLRMDGASLDAVLRPKVQGALALHAAFAGRQLDFFVLFSSLSALLPPPGQGAYAAANAFLDALAHHRRALGLPGLSIDWGPWAETGMAAGRPLPHAAGDGGGIALLDPAAALAALEVALAGGAAQAVAAGDVAWQRLQAGFFPRGAAPALLADLLPAPDDLPPTAPKVAPAALDCVDDAAFEQRLRELTAGVLQLPIERLNPLSPLRDLGFDSIMAVELRASVEQSLGSSLPMRIFLDAPSVRQLAGRLAEHLAIGSTVGGNGPRMES